MNQDSKIDESCVSVCVRSISDQSKTCRSSLIFVARNKSFERFSCSDILSYILFLFFLLSFPLYELGLCCEIVWEGVCVSLIFFGEWLELKLDVLMFFRLWRRAKWQPNVELLLLGSWTISHPFAALGIRWFPCPWILLCWWIFDDWMMEVEPMNCMILLAYCLLRVVDEQKEKKVAERKKAFGWRRKLRWVAWNIFKKLQFNPLNFQLMPL